MYDNCICVAVIRSIIPPEADILNVLKLIKFTMNKTGPGRWQSIFSANRLPPARCAVFTYDLSCSFLLMKRLIVPGIHSLGKSRTSRTLLFRGNKCFCYAKFIAQKRLFFLQIMMSVSIEENITDI